MATAEGVWPTDLDSVHQIIIGDIIHKTKTNNVTEHKLHLQESRWSLCKMPAFLLKVAQVGEGKFALFTRFWFLKHNTHKISNRIEKCLIENSKTQEGREGGIWATEMWPKTAIKNSCPHRGNFNVKVGTETPESAAHNKPYFFKSKSKVRSVKWN